MHEVARLIAHRDVVEVEQPLRIAADPKGGGGEHLSYVILSWYHSLVPPKVRDLVRRLENAGFRNRGGKGNHRNFKHPRGLRITISGSLHADAKPYQEKAVKVAVSKVTE